MAPFKSSLARSVGKLIGVNRQPDLSLRGATQESRKFRVTGPITATGGNKYTPGNGYIYHAFTNSMNSSPDAIFEQTAGGDTIDVLIVAGGGGGGGGYYAGGGGGGGILEGNIPRHQPGTFTITVGAGGAGGTGDSGSAVAGGNSSFDTVTALGGGKGGSGPGTNEAQPLLAGGSGGGKSYYPTPVPEVGQASPQPAPGDFTSYGNPAGQARSGSTTTGGGGGGAGAAGGGGGGNTNLNGGPGQAFPTWPSSVIPILTPLNSYMGSDNNTYGGGGGAGPSGTAGNSIAGGGGPGGSGSGGAAGIDYLGGGGGGSSDSPSPGPATGGVGGAGIVLIRYSAS